MPGVVAQHLQDQDPDRREEQEHRAELASDWAAEQWQRDQLSHLSTPELHDRWVSAVREFWAESETLDFHNGSPVAAGRAAELEAQSKLIYTEMNKPERAAELHELEQAPPWIEQTVTPENSLRDRVSALSDFHLYDAYNGTEQELDSQRDWNIQHPERQVSTVALESQAEIIAAEFRSRPSLNQSRDQQGLSY